MKFDEKANEIFLKSETLNREGEEKGKGRERQKER